MNNFLSSTISGLVVAAILAVSGWLLFKIAPKLSPAHRARKKEVLNKALDLLKKYKELFNNLYARHIQFAKNDMTKTFGLNYPTSDITSPEKAYKNFNEYYKENSDIFSKPVSDLFSKLDIVVNEFAQCCSKGHTDNNMILVFDKVVDATDLLIKSMITLSQKTTV